MISEDVNREIAIRKRAAVKPHWRIFVLVAGLIYALTYGWAEHVVHKMGERNRLFMIASAPRQSYDFVILGASHTMPFGFEDMTARLESQTNSTIINLSIEGAGIVPARFITDYFLARHKTKKVVYVLDSFAFYSSQWNEERIDDPKLLKRAPFDSDLLALLWRYPPTRDLLPGYLSGFYKINDADRFQRDVSDSERDEFGRIYRGNAYLDRQRLDYLYPKTIDPAVTDRYMAAFDGFARDLHDRGIELVVVRTPLPQRVLKFLGDEAAFDARIEKILGAYGFQLHDFKAVANDDKFFYDTDHLNRDGVNNFVAKYLADLLRSSGS